MMNNAIKRKLANAQFNLFQAERRLSYADDHESDRYYRLKNEIEQLRALCNSMSHTIELENNDDI